MNPKPASFRQPPSYSGARMIAWAALRVTALIAMLALAGCDLLDDPGSKVPPIETVADTIETLKNGESLSWKLRPGLYQLQLTADSPGVTVTWIGGDCRDFKERMREVVTKCRMEMNGQVKIANPSGFLGMGENASVTIKITRINIKLSDEGNPP